MADKTMMTKYIVKNQAIKENKTVTFMSKPVYNEAGKRAARAYALVQGRKASLLR